MILSTLLTSTLLTTTIYEKANGLMVDAALDLEEYMVFTRKRFPTPERQPIIKKLKRFLNFREQAYCKYRLPARKNRLLSQTER